MLTVQAASILTFLATTTLVSAHGHVTSWTIGGVDRPGFNPSNAAQYGPTAERPTDNRDQGFSDWTSGIVACGGVSAGSGLLTYDVDAGSTVTAKWNTWPDSHKGPVTEYMARCPSSGCDGVAADSLDWFKIQQDILTADGKWATESIPSSLKWDFRIPSDLAPGHELLAMHTVGAPQVYPVCFQANLKGSGSAVPTVTAKFPAAYNINPAFKTFDIYAGRDSTFVAPGPAVYGGGGGGAAPAPAPASSSAAPVRPSSSVAPAPASSSAAPVRPSSSAAPITPSSGAPVKPSSSPAAPVPTPPSTPPSTGGANLGGPVPAVTPSGSQWKMNGAIYNNEADAHMAACMLQMNKCKDWANSLKNSQVSAAFAQCDAQLAACPNGSTKRDVVNRYAKRGVLAF